MKNEISGSTAFRVGVCGDCGAEGLVLWCSCDRVLLCVSAGDGLGCVMSGHAEGCPCDVALEVLDPA
ncbi:hypothetical protein [Candidatus Poriferisodalis sp.]|uniref:hypothetical protein n=1 Tax=Candidatus Poriferisodalis sp. TaxID=3101277 RepID=UPI003C6F5297